MKKINSLLLALLSVLALTWTGCTEEVDYTPAGSLEGNGVYFPNTTKTSFQVEGATGELTFDVLRTITKDAQEAELKVTYGEGAEGIFTIPTTVSFAAGDTAKTLSVKYDKLVRGKSYTAQLSLADGTPYSNSTINISVFWPEEVVYEWEVISKDAIYNDNIFYAYGLSNIVMTGLTVEKAKGFEVYRFKSPYDNKYMTGNGIGGSIFSDDFEFPYIVLDGEKYKNEAPGKYYIAPTALGFKMTDGVGVSFDTKWTTIGSVAGNLQTASGPIPPASKDYPLVSYDKNKKVFNFGTIFHNEEGYGYDIVKNVTLSLDPALLGADYDRDYTWKDYPQANGYFTSELVGESWIQQVQVAEEDPTFYRLVNPYSEKEKAHLYFNLKEDGSVSLPKGQDVGLTSFGNTVYAEAVAGGSSWNAKNEILTLGVNLYIADENGKKVADLQSVKETLLWGQNSPFVTGKKIDDYVGVWSVPFTNGTEKQKISVAITKKDEKTLTVRGLSGLSPKQYNDAFDLSYNAADGLLSFAPQYLAPLQEGVDVLISPFNSVKPGFSDDPNDSFVAGVKKDGTFEFIPSETLEGSYDAMVFLVVQGGQVSFLTGYWSALAWNPAKATAAAFTVAKAAVGTSNLKKGASVSRRYQTDLKMEPKPVQLSKLSRVIDNASAVKFIR